MQKFEEIEIKKAYARDIALKIRYKALHGLATGRINPNKIDKALKDFTLFTGYCNVRYDSQKGIEYIIRGNKPVEVCKSKQYIEWDLVAQELKNMLEEFQDDKRLNPINFDCFKEEYYPKHFDCCPKELNKDVYKGLVVLYVLLNEEAYTRITFEEIFDENCSKADVVSFLKSNYPIGSYLYDCKQGRMEFNSDVNSSPYIGRNRRYLADKKYKGRIMCSPIANPFTGEDFGYLHADSEKITLDFYGKVSAIEYSWEEIAEVLVENDFYRFSSKTLPELKVNDAKKTIPTEAKEFVKEAARTVLDSIVSYCEMQENKKVVRGQLSLF